MSHNAPVAETMPAGRQKRVFHGVNANRAEEVLVNFCSRRPSIRDPAILALPGAPRISARLHLRPHDGGDIGPDRALSTLHPPLPHSLNRTAQPHAQKALSACLDKLKPRATDRARALTFDGSTSMFSRSSIAAPATTHPSCPPLRMSQRFLDNARRNCSLLAGQSPSSAALLCSAPRYGPALLVLASFPLPLDPAVALIPRPSSRRASESECALSVCLPLVALRWRAWTLIPARLQSWIKVTVVAIGSSSRSLWGSRPLKFSVTGVGEGPASLWSSRQRREPVASGETAAGRQLLPPSPTWRLLPYMWNAHARAPGPNEHRPRGDKPRFTVSSNGRLVLFRIKPAPVFTGRSVEGRGRASELGLGHVTASRINVAGDPPDLWGSYQGWEI